MQELVRDVKGQLAARQLRAEDGAASIIDYLAGRARQEILGRGNTLKGAEQILGVLLKAFSDGETLPQIQQKFFSHRQGHGDDLVGFSLKLLELFNSIARLDSSFNDVRDKTLKGEIGGGGTRWERELRRFNMDSPHLTFFKARDRAIVVGNQWWQDTYGSGSAGREVYQ